MCPTGSLRTPRGNVHDRHVVDVACGSFEQETRGANPHSGVYTSNPSLAAKNAADLEAYSIFLSAYRKCTKAIPHTRNNWRCYDFRERKIVPTFYTVHTLERAPGDYHHLLWPVETSVDGENCREVVRRVKSRFQEE
jgi:hypothetical protein